MQKYYLAYIILLFFATSLLAQRDYLDFLAQPKLEEWLMEDQTDQLVNYCDSLFSATSDTKLQGILRYYRGEANYQELYQEEALVDWQVSKDLFRQAKFQEGQVLSHFRIAALHFEFGQIEKSQKEMAQVLASARRLDHPTLLFEILQRAAILYSQANENIKAMGLLKEALKIAQDLKDKPRIKAIYNQISTNYYTNGALDSAIIYFEYLIAFKKEEQEQDASLISDLSTLGNLYNAKGDFAPAQGHLMEALASAEATQDSFLIISLCTDIAQLHVAQLNWEAALRYTQQAIQLARAKGLTFAEASNLKTQASIWVAKDSIDLAIQDYEAALKIFSQLNNNLEAANIQMQLGSLYQSNDNLVAAGRYLEEALDIREASNDVLGILQTKLVLGELNIKQGNFKMAPSYLLPCIDLAQQMNNKEVLQKAYRLLAESYAGSNDFQQAYQYYQRFSLIDNDIRSLENARIINEMEARFESEKKDRALAQQTLEITAQQSEIRQRNFQILALIIGLVAAVALVVLALFYFQQKRSLDRQQILVLEKEQEANRLQAIIEGEEKERRRIGRDLHDGLGALLASAKMRISTIEPKNEKAKQVENYQKAVALIDEACWSVREISHNMMPSILEQAGLKIALQNLCATLAESHGIRINFLPYAVKDDLPDHITVHIYRVAQELLKNSLKHAQASAIIVQLTQEADQLNLLVKDNGIGFDPSQRPSSNGIGLANIKARIAYLGGNLSFESSPGEGTIIEADISLSSNPKP